MKCHPVFNIDLLSKVQPDRIPGRRPKEPPPVVIEGEPYYEIEEIIDSNWYYGHLQYKVKYRGYDKEHDEWQFRDDLLEDMGEKELKEYETSFYKTHPDAPSLGKGREIRRKTPGRKVKMGKGKSR